MSLPFTTDEIVTNDLTVNNQANFRKNVYVGLDLTVVNTIRSEGTLSVNKLTSLIGDQGVFTISSDVCIATGKKLLCNKIIPKDIETGSVHDRLIPLNKFAHGRIWLNAPSFLIPVNNTPGEPYPATQLSPGNGQIIPFDSGSDSVFVYTGMLLSPAHWTSPATLPECEFNIVWVDVCAKVIIVVDSCDIGDRIELELRKNGGTGDVISRAVHTLSTQLSPGANHEITLSLCDLVRCDPEDTLDVCVRGWDIDTVGGPPVLNASVSGGNNYNSIATFKIVDVEYIIV